ncbi:SH3 domain-containing protein [Lacrimispora sp.]|uniref:SH3 domain-containing protein n=1 Tax=Lacrimispora sp. TaxID=2719234 RepID=UPI0028546334|nr:DUF4145 domain-containing protein [Lacrimispora sp.]MDR7812003.1 DUF4145 domain-containing protein [Lacrimispora sp.]
MGTTDNSFLLRIQQGQRETEKLMSQKQYNMAMIKARQTLEYMVNYLGERALIVEGDLADSIDQLFEGRFISQSAKDHYHRIRVLGNKAVHEGDDSPYDANEAFQLLSQEVNTFANSNNRGSQGGTPINKQPADVRTISSTSRNNPPRSSTSRNEFQGTGNQRSSGARTAPLRTQEHTGGAGRTGTRPDGARPGQRPAQKSVSRNGQRPASHSRSRRRTKKKGFDPYELLKPALIFLVLLVLVLIIVKLIPGKDSKKDPTTAETTAEVTTEAMTSAETSAEPTEPETEAPKIYTTKSKLNVRSEPSTDGAKLGSLASGTVVEYVKTYDDKWTVIMFEGTEAYVATEFLTESESETGTDAGESTSATENTAATTAATP